MGCIVNILMAYKIEWTKRGVIWTYSRTMTGEDILQSNLEIFGDERFDDLRYQIADMTAVDRIQMEDVHIRKMAFLDMAAARSNSKIRVAIVSTTDAAKDLGDAYKKYAAEKSPWETRIFSSRDAADAWVAEVTEGHST